MHTLFLWLRTLLNLDLTSGFDIACSFESRIESSPIFGRGLREDFFTGSGLPFWLLPKSFMNKSKPFGRYLRASFVEVKGNEPTASEHSTTGRLQLGVPEKTTRVHLSLYLRIRSGF
jgi:hypothetical protein